MEEPSNQIDVGERSVEVVIPIAWGGWDEVGAFDFQYYDVIMTEDFGSIRAGTAYDVVYVDYDRGVFEAYNDDDEMNVVQATVVFKAIAIPQLTNGGD